MIKSIYFASAAALLACAPVHAEEAFPAARPQVSDEVEFPSLRSATRPQGVFVPAHNIALIAPGMKKSQIYTLLDVPHFSEGLFGVRRWNYILNFYTGTQDEYRQCQYQIRFDRSAKVETSWWKDSECARLYEDALKPSVAAAVAPAAPAVERAVKSYSFNFDFNSVAINRNGDDVLRQIAADVVGAQYKKIVVTGFTDTVGSTDYNDGLAARRAAATVADLTQILEAKGDALADRIYSRGGRDLSVETPQGVREEQNRRVLIELY